MPRGWRQKLNRKKRVATSRGPVRNFTITVGAENLATGGPIIFGSWGVPQALADALTAEGHDVPDPVTGAMLVDTGATSTCIAEHAAKTLRLNPIGVATGYGAAGKYENTIYFSELRIGVQAGRRQTTYFWQQQAQGIPDLEQHGRQIGLRLQNQPVDYVGLLGRDILRHVRFNYDGVGGVIRFEFDIESLGGSSV